MPPKPTDKPAAATKGPAKPAAPDTRPYGRIKVRATANGYYQDKMRRPGDVFTIPADPRPGAARGTKPAMFSDKWMERVSPETTGPSSTSHNDVLRKQHDETIAARITGAQTPAVDSQGQGVGDDFSNSDSDDAPTGDNDPLGD